LENAVSLTIVPGYIITVDANGKQVMRYPIASVLRAADIPSLTYTQVQAITALANLTVVLIRTLIDRQILDESFLEKDEYNLDDIIESIENMGGDFGEPDITVNT
jgi:hypothetical protein